MILLELKNLFLSKTLREIRRYVGDEFSNLYAKDKDSRKSRDPHISERKAR